MAQIPPAFIQAAAGYRHVCMMEGPDPELRLSTLQYETLCADNKRNADEIQRLRALLRKHNIEYDNSLPVTIKYVSRNASPEVSNNDQNQSLPTEIILRILGFALTSPVPIIDPFCRLRHENVTVIERFSRRYINIQCLSVSQVFKTEGTRILIENNDFVFTQAAALENFAKISPELRSTIKHVTLRVVGRYYDDFARQADLTGNGPYHDSIPRYVARIKARPRGMVNDKGIQAYCWFQLADFLRAMQLPRELMSNDRPKLFPRLESMRLDLVNFCDHLPLGMSSFAAVIRWHLGRIVDELVVTGLPDDQTFIDEQMVVRNLLRDEGLFSEGCPAFVSVKDGLKELPLYGYNQHVVNLKNKTQIMKVTKEMKSTPNHPEGGQPPKSSYPAGHTIWKWTKDHENKPKEWIEFDRASGQPIRVLEEEEEEEEEDGDDLNFDALLGLPFLPMFAPPFNPPGNEEHDDEDDDSDGMPELVGPDQ